MSPAKRHRHDRRRHDSKRLHKLTSLNPAGHSLLDDDDARDACEHGNDLFSFGRSSTTLTSPADNRSFLSLDPSKSQAFDFNSYLTGFTSEIVIKDVPSLAFSDSFRRAGVLDFEKCERLDMVKDRGAITKDNLLDEYELDCIVRANGYDSDEEVRQENERDSFNNFGIQLNNLKSHTNTEMTPNKGSANLMLDPTTSLTNDTKSNALSFSIFSDNNDTNEQEGEEDNLKSPKSSPMNTIKSSTIHLEPSTPPRKSASKFKACSPHHRTLRSPKKSSFKPSTVKSFHLFLETNDHNLDDAVRFATEINTMSGEKVPLPESITEIISIPTMGPPDGKGFKQSAIITGIKPKVLRKKIESRERFSHHLSQMRVMRDSTNIDTKRGKGFYSAYEKDDFLKMRKKGPTTNAVKSGSIKWADDLEW